MPERPCAYRSGWVNLLIVWRRQCFRGRLTDCWRGFRYLEGWLFTSRELWRTSRAGSVFAAPFTENIWRSRYFLPWRSNCRLYLWKALFWERIARKNLSQAGKSCHGEFILWLSTDRFLRLCLPFWGIPLWPVFLREIPDRPESFCFTGPLSFCFSWRVRFSVIYWLARAEWIRCF